MGSQHFSCDTHVRNLKSWTRNKNLVDANGKPVEGINADLLIQWLNEGQELIQEAIANSFNTAFASFVTKQITARAVSYPIPEQALFGNRIIRLDYGTADDPLLYRKIPLVDAQLSEYEEGEPEQYYVSGTNIITEPSPSSGYYRFLIQKQTERIDLRRGTVKQVATNAGNLTEIELENDTVLDQIAVDALGYAEFVCVVDYEGTTKIQNIPVQSYDSTNRKIMVRSGFAYTSGIAAGDYVVIGKYTTTHSQLPFACQKYYVNYCHYRIMNKDSSADKVDDIPVLQAIKGQILEGFADNADLLEIPIHGSLTGDWTA